MAISQAFIPPSPNSQITFFVRLQQVRVLSPRWSSTLCTKKLITKQILESDDPVTAKALGKKIHNFKIDEWKDVRDQYMKFGIHAKFD